MSGPVVMRLGPFQFQSHGFGFTDLGDKLVTPWAEIETAGRLNALQWTGPSSETMSVKGVLFPAEFGGESTLAGIRQSARFGVPQVLASAGGLIYGLQAIEEVARDRSYFDRKGNAHRVSYEIKLKKIGFGLSLFSLVRGF